MSIITNAGFIIPTPRFVDIGMPKTGVTTSGRYMLIKRDAWGAEIERTPWFDNIILDSGLNRWGTGAIILGAAIGTGTSTPAAGQSSLDTEIHWTTTTGTGATITAAGSSPYNNTRTVVYRTTLGALNGNYSEVGVGWATGSMFSRALILDGGGSPTTISVTSAQQLDIVYQLSVYPPIVDTGPDVITISGVNYDVIGRASYVNSISSYGWLVPTSTFSLTNSSSVGTYAYDGALGAITATPSGLGASFDGSTNNAYSNNSLNRTGTLTASLTSANLASQIASVAVAWSQLAVFQYSFSPDIPKDGTKTLVLNFSITWARRP